MTPFGRQPVTAGLLATQALAEAPAPDQQPDKWALLRDLTAARLRFGVTDRDLAVLSALLSFHPGKELADDARLIVFPSNQALSERAHGMAESTLRRHLAALVRAGLILRRDSPNGKRYATRGYSGALDQVFGFDLRPLLVRSPQITEAAEAARLEALALRRLREAVVIRLRDVAKLIAYGIEHTARDWTALIEAHAAAQRQLRRKLTADMLRDLKQEADALLALVTPKAPSIPEDMTGNDAQNGRHYQNSNPKLKESDLCQERQKEDVQAAPSVPLPVVLKAAPDIGDYAPDGIRHWQDLIRTADFVRPMLGISVDAWQRARLAMGPATAAVVLACILQRASVIARPGGYLRSLTEKAEGDGFSPGPMVMALIRAENTQAA